MNIKDAVEEIQRLVVSSEFLSIEIQRLVVLNEMLEKDVAILLKSAEGDRKLIKALMTEQSAQQEPVAWQNTANHMEIVSAEDWKNIDPMWHWMYRPLYPPAPPREWVGLTDEERAVIVEANTFDDHGYDIWCSGDWVAKAIESKLKDKNT